MIGWLIALAVVLLIALLPVGACCKYDGEAVVKLIIGPFRLQLVPAKPRSQGQQKKAEKKQSAKARKKKEAAAKARDREEKALQDEEPLKDKLEGLLPFLRLVVQLLGTLRRKLRIRRLVIHARLAGSDPAKTANTCGKAWEVIGMAVPLLRQAFRIKTTDFQVTPDFLADKTQVYAEISLRFFMGDLIAMAVKYGVKAIKLLFQRKKQQKLKKAVQQ